MMRTGCRRAACIAALLVFACSAGAGARPLEVTLAASIDAISGQHQVGNGEADRFSLLPLPLGEATIRAGADTLRVEGLPPISVPYTGGSRLQSTRLSIVNATLRHAFAGGWFVGAGQTVYNQSTQYANPPNEVQSSRVTGLRVELGRTFGTAANRIEAFGAVNGRMHGVQYTTYAVPGFTCAGCPPGSVTFADPENAAQVDLNARLAHRVWAHGDLLLGLRYLNYTAHYDVAPGVLADRNVGFAPTLGLRVHL